MCKALLAMLAAAALVGCSAPPDDDLLPWHLWIYSDARAPGQYVSAYETLDDCRGAKDNSLDAYEVSPGAGHFICATRCSRGVDNTFAPDLCAEKHTD
jgi:hypothetical protein